MGDDPERENTEMGAPDEASNAENPAAPAEGGAENPSEAEIRKAVKEAMSVENVMELSVIRPARCRASELRTPDDLLLWGPRRRRFGKRPGTSSESLSTSLSQTAAK
jgi:hypothetical protein